MGGRPQPVLLWLLCTLAGSLRASAAFKNPDYLPTLPEDPLQPVWDSMDTIPEEVLNGFKDQMDFYNQQIQTSLTEILSRLSTLEEKMQQEVTNLREQIGDLVTDRLVNAETMILEDISNFSKVMLSSLRKNCNIQDHAVSLTGKLAGMVNATVTEATTTCSSRTEEEVARVEEAAAKVEVAAARVEEEAARVEEATSRVEEMVAKMENVTHNNYSAISAEVCGTVSPGRIIYLFHKSLPLLQFVFLFKEQTT